MTKGRICGHRQDPTHATQEIGMLSARSVRQPCELRNSLLKEHHANTRRYNDRSQRIFGDRDGFHQLDDQFQVLSAEGVFSEL